MSKKSYWNLYWVESDGWEDCFVIAKNSSSACRIEREMNGFDVDDLQAKNIMRIPEKVHKSYKKQDIYKEKGWPWYAFGKKFFEGLGAQFRTIDGKEEMLLEDVVYSIEDYIPCSIRKKRSIGKKAITELKASELGEYPYHDEDSWNESQQIILTMLGILLARCHQIEEYVANSFLFGAFSEREKYKNDTINDVRKRWKKKTFGGMLRSIEDGWEIDPLVKANFELFRQQRNLLIHGITTHEEYDINTQWGQDELVAFLSFFDVVSRVVRSAFRASCNASISLAVHHWGVPDGMPEDFFDKQQEEEITMFFEFFSLKDNVD